MVESEKKWRQRSFFFALESISEVKIAKKKSSTLPFFHEYEIIRDYSVAYPWIIKKKRDIYGTSQGSFRFTSDIHGNLIIELRIEGTPDLQ